MLDSIYFNLDDLDSKKHSGFKDLNHFNSHLNYLFRTDAKQKYTNEFTQNNIYYITGDTNDDIFVIRDKTFNLNKLKKVKRIIYDRYKKQWDKLRFVRVTSHQNFNFPQWNRNMTIDMERIINSFANKHNIVAVVVHADQFFEYDGNIHPDLHFHILYKN